MKLTKFYQLKPEHVLLFNDMPSNMCICKYHANFIEAISSLHKNVVSIPKYGEDLFHAFLCNTPSKKCWVGECICGFSSEAFSNFVNNIDLDLDTNISWLNWEEDKISKRMQKVNKRGSIKELVSYICSISKAFFLHHYIKCEQSQCFSTDCASLAETNEDEAVLQIDFAENFVCVAQDEIQSAHWNQKQLTLFTTSLQYSGKQFSKVYVSDNNDHSKSTIVPYLFKILQMVPPTIKTVKIWSDGPVSQFKNKYIGAFLVEMQKWFPFKIIWNFFATSHGKSCVDGIGAVVKRSVSNIIRCRRKIVNNAKEFSDAYRMTQSVIECVEVTQNDFDFLSMELEMDKLFRNSKALRNIVKYHQLQVYNNKLVGYLTSNEGYQNLNFV